MKITGGMITALITPFKENGEIDLESLKKLVKHQVQGGVDGIVVSGTTAESPNLSYEEVGEIFNCVKENTPENFQIIMGAGTNSTKGTIEKIKMYEKLDFAGYLLVVPYYNKPTQDGMLAHFKACADATQKDLLLYDVPGRTVVEMSSDTAAKLSKIKNIVGIKDATGNLNKIKELISHPEMNPEFLFLSGDDGTTCDFNKLGGHGAISVLSHVVPKEFKEAMMGEGDFSRLKNLADLLFVEPNPTPVKFALKEMGVIESDQVRLPLLKMSSDKSAQLKAELQTLGVL
jgi:4-hydroxy-tetrahydrodipicolinate synthase